MAALSALGGNLCRVLTPVQKSGTEILRRWSFSENLESIGWPRGVESISNNVMRARGAVRARAPEFGRRFIRVQVNPRSSELATIRSVPVQVARELVNAGHHYLDVRTAEEFAAGHVEGAVNIPFLKNAGAGMTKNLRFVEEVSRVFGKDDEIVVACQSGKRSLMAAAELNAAEFSAITDVVGGYKAWSESGLPTAS